MSKQPHKHAALIKAWADDPSIKLEFKNFNGNWSSVHGTPAWDVRTEYRIKPEPKPDVVEEIFIATFGRIYGHVASNLRLTFSGETGELIKAEVLR